MIYVGTLVQGVDERGRIIRRTLMRYLSLASVITFQSISTVAKKRFPTYAHMLEAGGYLFSVCVFLLTIVF